MGLMKRVGWLIVTGCLLLSHGWVTQSRASAQGDMMPGAVEGVFTPVPLTLWEGGGNSDNNAGETITSWELCAALSEVLFHNGDTLYYQAFIDGQGELHYRTIDLSTMQVSIVDFPRVFGGENILSARSGEDYCHVLTNSAVYTFDEALALVRRTPWPTALRALMDQWADEENVERSEWVWYGWDVNPSGTAIVYQDISSWLLETSKEPKYGEDYFSSIGDLAQKDANNKFISVCALQPDAIPKPILASVTRPADYFETEEYATPFFVDDDRLLVKNWGWEWVNYWEVWDLQGRRLFDSVIVELWDDDVYPGDNQAENAYGAFVHNPETLTFPSSFYIDYQTLRQERIPLLSHPPYDGEWLFCALEGRSCVFAMSVEDDLGKKTRIEFFRYRFDTQAVEPLPLALQDATLVQAALAPGGRILFLYGENDCEPQYAGMFQCP